MLISTLWRPRDENVGAGAQGWRLAVRIVTVPFCTARAPLGIALGAIFALTSRHALAEELTATSAANRAVQASYEVAAARSAHSAAQARVDQASYSFLPKVTVSARYTRLSDFTPSPLFPFAVAATEAPAGTAAPPTVSTGPVAIAPILDNYALDATLLLPITDYVLRLARGLDAVKHGREAAKWETVVAESRARLAGKIAFYEWVRANAAVDAAKQSVAEEKAHLTDVTSQVGQGNASRADVLRVKSAVAGADANLAEANARLATAEAQLRTLLHLSDSTPLGTHDAVDTPLEPVARSKAEWVGEAYRTRAELRELAAAESSSRSQAGVARATYLPTLGAFANATYANPNPRYFPPKDEWHATWAVGASATWALTDIPGARAAAAEADARGDALAAQRSALRDVLVVEIVQYFESARAADAKVDATDRQLESAAEAYRVTRALSANARATTAQVLDAETDLARSRLAWINARVDARVARARLDHAAGRDQHPTEP
jgi:outer membrane protein